MTTCLKVCRRHLFRVLEGFNVICCGLRYLIYKEEKAKQVAEKDKL